MYRCTGLAGSFLDVDICTLGCAMSSPYLGSPWKWWCSDSQEHGNLWQFVGAFVEHQGNQACRRCIFLATSMSNGDTGTGLFCLANREMRPVSLLSMNQWGLTLSTQIPARSTRKHSGRKDMSVWKLLHRIGPPESTCFRSLAQEQRPFWGRRGVSSQSSHRTSVPPKWATSPKLPSGGSWAVLAFWGQHLIFLKQQRSACAILCLFLCERIIALTAVISRWNQTTPWQTSQQLVKVFCGRWVVPEISWSFRHFMPFKSWGGPGHTHTADTGLFLVNAVSVHISLFAHACTQACAQACAQACTQACAQTYRHRSQTYLLCFVVRKLYRARCARQSTTAGPEFGHHSISWDAPASSLPRRKVGKSSHHRLAPCIPMRFL